MQFRHPKLDREVEVDDELAVLATRLKSSRGDLSAELVIWNRIDALLDLRLTGQPAGQRVSQ